LIQDVVRQFAHRSQHHRPRQKPRPIWVFATRALQPIESVLFFYRFRVAREFSEGGTCSNSSRMRTRELSSDSLGSSKHCERVWSDLPSSELRDFCAVVRGAPK